MSLFLNDRLDLAEKLLLFCLGYRNDRFLTDSLEGILSDLLKDLGLNGYLLKLGTSSEGFLADRNNVLADSDLLKFLVVLEGLCSNLGDLVLDLIDLNSCRNGYLCFCLLIALQSESPLF